MKRTDLKRKAVTEAWLVAAVLLLSACASTSEQATSGPEPAEPAGQAIAKGATCAAHGAPKDLCFICDASLRDEGRLWCREHSRYEDRFRACRGCGGSLDEQRGHWARADV
jgi:hypothetical protein